MARYVTDLEDIYFNLFNVLEVQNLDYEMDEGDCKEVLRQLDSFIENEYFSVRTESDHIGAQLKDGKVIVPPMLKKAVRAFIENGWHVLGLPEEQGGMPVPHAVYSVGHSMWTGANVSASMYAGLTRAAMNVILAKGTDEQKQKFANPILEGRWGGTMCLTEAGAGSDVGALRSTATPNGDGSYQISGTKIFISSGDSDIYDNNIHLVLARTPEGKPGSKGISLFIVPKIKVNDDGSLGDSNDVVCSKIEEKMGIHAQGTCELIFGGEGKCTGYLIGEEFDGMANMFLMMNEARLSCAIQGEAQLNLGYQLTKQYVSERAQFGKEIVNHPDVRRMLIKTRSLARGMRALCMYLAHLFDVKEGEPEVALLTPVAKAYCTDFAFISLADCVQMHGGYGYCTEYGVEQFLRDSKIAKIYEGTNGIQAIDFVARKILKDGGKAVTNLATKIASDLEMCESDKLRPAAEQIKKYMGGAQKIIQQMGAWSQGGQVDKMLENCTDFQTYFGHIVVSWRLYKNASIANRLLESGEGSEDQKKHYKELVDDLKIFNRYYLTQNEFLQAEILESQFDVMDVPI